MKLWHMTGAGNTFAVVDARGLSLDFQQTAIDLCRRTGADGFLAADCAHTADFRLHFYNSDGSRAALCGNGARCICRFAYENGIAPESMTVQTDAGLLSGCRIREDVYRISLPVPQKAPSGLVTVGVPHYALQVPGLRFDMADPLRQTARRLRQQWDANVDFFDFLSADHVRVLTYERGVEDFTAACGTGCAAVAATLGRSITAQNRGGSLTIDFEGDSPFLTGSARILHVVDL